MTDGLLEENIIKVEYVCLRANRILGKICLNAIYFKEKQTVRSDCLKSFTKGNTVFEPTVFSAASTQLRKWQFQMELCKLCCR